MFFLEVTLQDSQVVLVHRPLCCKDRRLYLPKLKYTHTYLFTPGYVIFNISYNKPFWTWQARQDSPPPHCTLCFGVITY